MGITEELRCAAAKLMNVTKFAVDSAVGESLIGGLQVYAIVKGKLKGDHDQHSSNNSNSNKNRNLVLVEEMQEDTSNIHQQSTNSALIRTQEQDCLKQLFDEPLKRSFPEVTNQRKIFIRSRL